MLNVAIDYLSESESIDLIPYAFAYLDTTHKIGLEEIMVANMIPLEQLGNVDSKNGMLPYTLWLKVNIQFDAAVEEDQLAIYMPKGYMIEVFEVQKENIQYSFGGIEYRAHSSQVPFNKDAFPLRILNDDSHTVYLKTRGFLGKKLELSLVTVDFLREKRANKLFDRRLEYHYWSGLSVLFFFLGLFFILRYAQYKETFLFWYGLYLIAIGFNQLFALESNSGMKIFWNILPFGEALYYSFIGIPFIFLGHYLRSMLDFQQGTHIFRTYRIFINSLYGAVSINVLLNLFRYSFSLPIGGDLHQLMYIPSSYIGIYLGYLIWRNDDKIHKLIGTGILILTIGCIVFSAFVSAGFFGHYHLIVEVAIIIEIVFLTLAIGYREKMTYSHLIDTQRQLLNVKSENLEMQEKLNSELTALVEAKSKDLVEKNRIIALQEKTQLESDFNEKLATAELKALKAQLNPHFIFNCLNAIRNLVERGEGEQATEYLSDFSSFIRRVLNYSEVKLITLEEELELCMLYLRMEQLRFEQGFEYRLIVDEDVAVDFVKVPPMLMQPLLENAIWHGLLHKKRDRKVELHISGGIENVVCTIDDNGIGRDRAHLIKGEAGDRKSMGMKLFTDRIALNNQLLQAKLHYEIIDKYDGSEATGTKIKLLFEI